MVDSTEAIHLSSVTLVEAGIVVEARQGPDAARDLDLLMAGVDAQAEAVTLDQAHLALAAWKRFGKGRHPAGLNLGDCFSYALARHLGSSLLFKGWDFSQTDVVAALP
jgi:ribonuclease VapC